MSSASSVTPLTDADFKGLLKARNHILIKFWAPWCQPCKILTPIFEQAAARHDEVAFGEVNVEEQQAMGARLGIRALPTIQGWSHGNLIFSHVGLLSAPELDKLIANLVKED